MFPSIRAEENINLAEVKELIQDWQSAMKDIDNLHQQSSTSKTLQEFSKDYLTLNRENQQHKSRIKQLENEIANLKILAELENQELAAKIQVLPK